jgi:hypothetical protein
MFAKSLVGLCVVSAISGVFCVPFALHAELTGQTASTPKDEPQTAATQPVESDQRVTKAVSRERAELMHRIFAATLDVMHDRYFHDSRAVVPARAMEDVFTEMARQSHIEARWISVNTRAMSLNHEPQSDFEKTAAKEIAAGKEVYERVENGYYRRAGAIPLASGCVNCHSDFFKQPPKSPRFAGLVISVPVNEK